MVATTFALAVDASHQPRQRRRKPWTPDDNATLVYQWVKFEGKRQGWVAQALRISQSTVSRIVERYEKWLAHGRVGAEGGLNEAERQRSQRWLTFERNEIILASCLRIAGDMEGCRDVSRSVVTRPMGEPTGETEVRTTHESIDRSGIAARFLRLAFQINMQQLKIAEKEPLPVLPPLDEQESARQADEAAADTAEIESAHTRPNEQEAIRRRVDAQVEQALAAEVERRIRAMEDEGPMGAAVASSSGGERMVPSEDNYAAGSEGAATGLKLHKLHNGRIDDSSANGDSVSTCAANPPANNFRSDACIVAAARQARNGS